MLFLAKSSLTLVWEFIKEWNGMEWVNHGMKWNRWNIMNLSNGKEWNEIK